MGTSRRNLSVAFIAGLALSASACTQFAANAPSVPQTTVFPVSDVGGLIQGLYELIFWMALVVFVGVEGFFVYAILRFRRRAGDNTIPAQIHGNTRLEIAWTIIPSVVLLIIAVPTIATIFRQDAVPSAGASGEPPMKILVTGRQWFWEFRYPDLRGAPLAVNEVHVPVNRTVVFELRSADVVHSFWIPRLGGKMDVIPTRVNHLWFTPLETGEFFGQCVEFCGIQHANMRVRLYVDTAAEFQNWAARQAADAASPASPQAQQGAVIFQRGACPACHTIKGTSAGGTIGPDLTHVGSRSTLAAGMLQNTYENLTHWIADPQGIKPGSKMRYPNDLPPSPGEAALMAAYLQSLK
ncbi:MAG: cytochrome c oxidase subunit II [Chloroflexi bacterium]|nr:cytochrome c oxidase subunit II [Chloroflexota bacterium]